MINKLKMHLSWEDEERYIYIYFLFTPICSLSEDFCNTVLFFRLLLRKNFRLNQYMKIEAPIGVCSL